MIRMYIGFDDTDSLRTGCTTYIAALLLEELLDLEVSFIDYPNLIRLNPNVPWKTRGNGALCLRIECSENIVEEVMEKVVNVVEENSDLQNNGTDPGVVFLFNDVPKEINTFAKKTIQGIVEMNEALKLIEMFKGEAFGFKGCRGIIGGLAAIGETLDGDHTFEILTYRMPENRGSPRRVQISSIFKMNKKTTPFTFNNIDPEMRRVLITPRGPDPVLYGIRGETPDIVKKGYEVVRSQEKIERWVIFRTNQGTDAHFRRVWSINEISPFNPVILRGVVIREPRVIPGGHVIFSLKDDTSARAQVDCAAYEPTGGLRKIVKRLIVGDLVEVYGGVRPKSSKHNMTINLEKVHVLKLAPKNTFHNPMCPRCDKRMESIGANKGYRCKKCGFQSSTLKKMTLEVDRNLQRGLYVAPPRSQRHLTKPLSRYGYEKKSPINKQPLLQPFFSVED